MQLENNSCSFSPNETSDTLDVEWSDKKKSLEHEFATSTSCHGLGNIATSSETWRRLFWIAATLACFGVFVWQVITLFFIFLRYEAVTELYVEHNTRLPFPAVTICNYNRWNKTKLYETSLFHGLDETVFHDYLDVASSDPPVTVFDDLEKTLQRFDELERNLTSAGFSDDIESLVQLHSNTLEKTVSLYSCKWRGVHLANCSRYFHTVVTNFGTCFVFNHNVTNAETLYQRKAGYRGGLELNLFVNTESYAERITGNFEVGFKYFVGPNYDFPRISEKGHAVSAGVHQYTAMHLTKYKNIKPPYGRCVDKKLKYFPYYSINNCEVECSVDLIFKRCGCFLFGTIHSGVKPFCDPSTVLSCVIGIGNEIEIEDCRSKCKPACLELGFQLYNSAAKLPSPQIADEFSEMTGFETNMLRENLVVLNVYYKTLQNAAIQQKQGTTITQVLSNVGGNMGLCLGMSIITVMEFLEFLGKKAHSKMKRCCMCNERRSVGIST